MVAKEKRRAPRARHNSVLEILDQGGHSIAEIGRLVNFSAVGACFSSTRVFGKGEKLYARLRLLKEGVLMVTARVVWVQKKTNAILYGIEFLTTQNVRV
ncbi:MAG: PilZ domain-containing protein [Elusimicrobiota bacterium]|jgi:hypothetical protein